MNNKSSGCVEVIVVMVIMGFVITYLPIIGIVLGVILAIVISVVVYKKTKARNEEKRIALANEERQARYDEEQKEIARLEQAKHRMELRKLESEEQERIERQRREQQERERQRRERQKYEQRMASERAERQRQEQERIRRAREQEEKVLLYDTNFDTMTGEEFEAYCALLLLKNGFNSAEVTKASGDQGIDVIAKKDGIKYGIQCKCYASDIGNKAVQEVYAGMRYYDCHIGVALTNRYFTQSAKTLAKKNRVVLWDRSKLMELVNSANQKQLLMEERR